MGFFSWLDDLFTNRYSWNSTKRLPNWVWKAHQHWQSRLSIHPYNMIFYIKGKHRRYKIVHGMGNQGEAPIIGMYYKLRRK